MLLCKSCNQEISDPNWFPFNCACGARTLKEEARMLCIHLGEPTGEVQHCRTCGNQSSTVPVYACVIFGKALLKKPTPMAGKPVWDGAVCLTCPRKELS